MEAIPENDDINNTNGANNTNKKKKKKKKKTAEEIKNSLVNYMIGKQGLMGEATRAIQKKKLQLKNVMDQTN